MARDDTADYRALFLTDVPLMDTRAPVEFARGAFPSAVNLPLMTDDERHAIGIRYKESGQAAAIELGHELVAGQEREARIQGWCDFARAHPEGYLYCFRGGLRSATARQWMRESGVDYPLVVGGYKAMRRFLIDELERSLAAADFLLIAGKTGCGKTRVIDAVDRAIDLEGLALHRGSSFGRLLDPQPTQIDFENALSIELMRGLAGGNTLVLEDEGKLIGRLSLPHDLRDKMRESRLLVVEESVASRVEVIFEDYILDLGARYRDRHADSGPEQHALHLREGLARIRKRLGGELHTEIDQLMQQAFAAVDEELHRRWIELLLVKYYDPMYEYQIGQREGVVVAAGSRDEIIALARELSRA
ncbi:MAG: tRNA 2-selenouridine(34) synthase MnmH [Halieaceae bacterium]|nr:tRNA 2-selenouridine(34) synthase MnmH [Halieaceae bacterium]